MRYSSLWHTWGQGSRQRSTAQARHALCTVFRLVRLPRAMRTPLPAAYSFGSPATAPLVCAGRAGQHSEAGCPHSCLAYARSLSGRPRPPTSPALHLGPLLCSLLHPFGWCARLVAGWGVSRVVRNSASCCCPSSSRWPQASVCRNVAGIMRHEWSTPASCCIIMRAPLKAGGSCKMLSDGALLSVCQFPLGTSTGTACGQELWFVGFGSCAGARPACQRHSARALFAPSEPCCVSQRVHLMLWLAGMDACVQQCTCRRTA